MMFGGARSGRWSLTAAVLTAAAVQATAVSAAEPPGRTVALLDGSDAYSSDLYVVSADGSSRRLPVSPFTQAPLMWHDDTHEIIYQQDRFDGAVRAVAPDGSSDRMLAPAPGVVSPDGRWVTQVRDGALWIVEAGGGQERRLTPEGAPRLIDPHDPAWDASSYRLAVRAVSTHGEGAEIYITDITGGGMVRVSPLELDAGRPVWSPGDDWIAFRASDELWKVRPDGGELTALTDLAHAGPIVTGRVAWSPDGTLLATHVRCRNCPAGLENGIYTVRSDGTGLRQVSPEVSDGPVQIGFSDDARVLVHDTTTYDSADATFYRSYMIRLPDATVHELDGDGASGIGWDHQYRPIVHPGVVHRTAGITRIHTAVQVSRQVFDDAAAVVVARADLYPDGLAGSPLAGQVGGPVLLTHRDGLAAVVGEEIERLGATSAWLLGDESALSDQVAADLTARGVTDVRRLAGPTRFDTAAAIARHVGGSHVYIVEGADVDPSRGWPDAVAVSGLAAHRGHPILLTTTEVLPDATVRAIDDLEVDSATIVGGRSAVSAEVEQALRDRGLQVDRLSGATRYETSVAVAEASLAAGLDASHAWLATGRNWPDSLAAGPAVAHRGGVLLMVDGHDLDDSPPARSWLDDHATVIEAVRLIGGPDVLRPALAVEIERLIPS